MADRFVSVVALLIGSDFTGRKPLVHTEVLSRVSLSDDVFRLLGLMGRFEAKFSLADPLIYGPPDDQVVLPIPYYP